MLIFLIQVAVTNSLEVFIMLLCVHKDVSSPHKVITCAYLIPIAVTNATIWSVGDLPMANLLPWKSRQTQKQFVYFYLCLCPLNSVFLHVSKRMTSTHTYSVKQHLKSSWPSVQLVLCRLPTAVFPVLTNIEFFYWQAFGAEKCQLESCLFSKSRYGWGEFIK